MTLKELEARLAAAEELIKKIDEEIGNLTIEEVKQSHDRARNNKELPR